MPLTAMALRRVSRLLLELLNKNAGGLILSVLVAIPLLGCVLAVYTRDTLIIWMEGFFVLAPLMWFVVVCLIEYLK